LHLVNMTQIGMVTLISMVIYFLGRSSFFFFFFFQAEDGIRDGHVTGVQTCALPISADARSASKFCETCCRAEPESGAGGAAGGRSEERRVGKECRSRWSAEP